ncbi:hypothetical protein [Mycetocola tolaasinivorans]|uniref:hypothetical protein n=1 Tax=Mycetocola tolaasinivorans TaxID=76635 RepID=UPI000EF54191|nr:hypothetical protein [Mycetocola tolaasinivorans]
MRPFFRKFSLPVVAVFLAAATLTSALGIEAAAAQSLPAAPSTIAPEETESGSGGGSGGGVGGAAPGGTATPSPNPSPSGSTSPDPLPRPVITAPAAKTVVSKTSTTVRGTAEPGQAITVLRDGSQACTAKTGGDGTFSCTISGLTTTPNITLVARYGSGAGTDAQAVVFAAVTPPTIDSTAGAAQAGLIRGTGYPGATVTLRAEGVGTWDTTVAESGRWAQSLPLRISGDFRMSAIQRTSFSGSVSSDPSPTVTLRVDTLPPPAPTITSPAAGSSLTGRTQYGGAGETGATVTIYAVPDSGGDAVLCSAEVSAGRWSCSADMPSTGAASLIAYQTDSSGNPGDTTPPIRIVYGPNPGGKIPPPPPPPGASASPSAPAQPEEPSPTPSSPEEPPSTAQPGPPSADGGVNPPAAAHPWNWDARSAFTHAVAPVLGPTAADGWLGAFLLALATIALVLVPARFLAGGMRRRGPLRFTGRNRSQPEPEDPADELSVRHPVLVGTALILVLALVVVFAMPLRQDAAQLRLFGAALVGLVFVNTAGTVLPALLSTRRFAGRASVTVAPRYLGAAIAASVISRFLGLEPALVFGIVLAVTLVPEASRRQRAGAAGIRVFSVFGLGVLGWIASSLLGSANGVAGAFLAEVANVTAMAGIGTAAILLIPLGQTSGRAILAYGPWRWLGAALPVYTTLFALLWPAFGHLHSPEIVPAALILALLFGGIGLGSYLWRTTLRGVFVSSR